MAEKTENGSKMPQQYTIDGRQYTIEMSPKQKFFKTEMSQKLKCYQNKIVLS